MFSEALAATLEFMTKISLLTFVVKYQLLLQTLQGQSWQSSMQMEIYCGKR